MKGDLFMVDESYKKLEQFRLAVLGKKQPKQRKKKKEKQAKTGQNEGMRSVTNIAYTTCTDRYRNP